MSAGDSAPIEVFVSYSHKDERLREMLGAHLNLLKREGVIDEWHDRRIAAGREWAGTIDEHLNSAAVILLLVSPDFLASDYCYDLEMKLALQRHDAGEARVIPVIMRSVDWRGAPFDRLQALPKDGRPVTSWADRDNAFANIARGIRQAVQSLRGRPSKTSPSRTQGLPAIWNVPYLRNPHFTGRDELLDQLHAKLTSGRVALTAVRGMGGVGKTQLALEYAYRHSGEFDLVWWLRAEEPATLLEDYAALAEPLGVRKVGEGDLAALADAVREALTRRDRWLLVFNNATGPDDVTDLLPRAGGGHVLITSRNPSWPFAVPLDVPVLDREAAVRFLLERTDQHNASAANVLADQLGDLPLALEQAAAYIVKTGLALADYVGFFRKRQSELWGEEKAPAGYPATVGTTLTLAVDRLQTEEPRAVDLLNLCAFLADEAIPRSLLTDNHEELPSELSSAVADPLRLNRLIAALRRYSLVQVTGEGFGFHRIVQAATRDSMTADERQQWIEAALTLMRAGFPYSRNPGATSMPSGALVAHALAAAGHAASAAVDLEGASRLLNEAASFLQGRGEFARAKTAYERALKLAETSLGPQHPDVATYVTNLGYLLSQEGDLAGAQACFERALRIDEVALGPEHPKVAIGASNLASLLEAQGHSSAAKSYFERALKVRDRIVTDDEPPMTGSGNTLAYLPAPEPSISAAVISQEDQLMLLRSGAPNWNNWRRANPHVRPNLRSSNLSDTDLAGANLSNADCYKADLRNARLRRSLLQGADFTRANLASADLRQADVTEANLAMANLSQTNLEEAQFAYTLFSSTNLRSATGLDTCVFLAPSPLDFRTLNISGPLSTVFLRGCGFPDKLIEYLPSLLDTQINTYYYFIIHSSQDEAFVRQIHGDLQDLGIRCWFVPENLRIGERTGETVGDAVQSYDTIILILSRNSMNSEWVNITIREAVAREKVEHRPILFPIIVDDSVLRTNDASIVQLVDDHRIGDFREWKDRLAYRRSLKNFTQFLRMSEPEQGQSLVI